MFLLRSGEAAGRTRRPALGDGGGHGGRWDGSRDLTPPRTRCKTNKYIGRVHSPSKATRSILEDCNPLSRLFARICVEVLEVSWPRMRRHAGRRMRTFRALYFKRPPCPGLSSFANPWIRRNIAGCADGGTDDSPSWRQRRSRRQDLGVARTAARRPSRRARHRPQR